MKYTDFASTKAPQTYVVQPDQFKRNRLRNNIATNIARDRARPQPTADDLAIGFARYCQVQKQANRRYEISQRTVASQDRLAIPASQRVKSDLTRILESEGGLHPYIGLVRVKIAGGTCNIRTQIHADGLTQAWKLLQYLYGVGNVMAVVAASKKSN